MVIFPAPYYGFKFGEVAKYYTTMGWGSVVAYPLAANNKFWAKLPAEIKKIITEEMVVYEAAVGDESTTKYSTALANLKKQGVTVRDLGDTERKKMAIQIEPWVQKKANEYNAKGVPGSESFNRLQALIVAGGAKPIYQYSIK